MGVRWSKWPFMPFEAAEQGIYCIDTKGSAFDNTDVFDLATSPVLSSPKGGCCCRTGCRIRSAWIRPCSVEIELQAEQAVDIRSELAGGPPPEISH